MKTKEITICGQLVKLMYCAAAENGFEDLSGKSIYDFDFTKNSDMLHLSMACIVSAYTAEDQEPPITSKDLLYSATQKEILDLYMTVINLRKEWYGVTKVLANQLQAEEDAMTEEEKEESRKNGETPMTD